MDNIFYEKLHAEIYKLLPKNLLNGTLHRNCYAKAEEYKISKSVNL